jgi:hypothetical protein
MSSSVLFGVLLRCMIRNYLVGTNEHLTLFVKLVCKEPIDRYVPRLFCMNGVR